MNRTLTPSSPMIEKGKLFNLIVHSDPRRIKHQQFMVKESFDYTQLLEEIRSEGLIKTEDIHQRLYEVLLSNDLIEHIESYILDLGTLGRPSTAVQDYYRHKLNSNSSLMKVLKSELFNGHFTFTGPECEIHMLSVDSGEVMGHVLISLDDGSGLYADFTLDLVGPCDADFPVDFNTVIEERLTRYLQDNHPGLSVVIKARVRRSMVWS